jgi:hypothetical protein
MIPPPRDAAPQGAGMLAASHFENPAHLKSILDFEDF